MTNNVNEGLDEGDDEKVGEETSRGKGKESDAARLSLPEKARRWFMEGFLRGAEDRLLRVNPDGILTELCLLFVQAVRYLRLPLDAAFAILEAEIDLGDEEETVVERSECILGFGCTSMSGNSIQDISTQSNIRFRPEKLLVSPIVANDFMIVGLKIGKNSQFTRYADVSIPASSFCLGDRMSGLDVCEKGQFITVTVQNLSGSTKIFAGSISGPPVEG